MDKIKDIKPTEYYTPKQIRDNGWILNSKGQKNYSSYIYILKMINKGILKAESRSIDSEIPRHLIKGEEIIRFLKETPHLA